MANHVANFLNINGPDSGKVLALMKTPENSFDFNRILPCPPVLESRTAPLRPEGDETEEEINALREALQKVYGASSWYEWCIEHWSTKWNSYNHYDIDGYDVVFYTAWGPPHEVYCTLTRYFDVEITIIDHDDGGSFCTEMVYHLGACQSMRDLEPDEVKVIEELLY
jgi:hypothetical protein